MPESFAGTLEWASREQAGRLVGDEPGVDRVYLSVDSPIRRSDDRGGLVREYLQSLGGPGSNGPLVLFPGGARNKGMGLK